MTARILPLEQVSQMVTYLFVIENLECFKSLELKSRVKTKRQKMLLSLRSNPQTGEPYIQERDSLCTWTDHHLITTYCSTYDSPCDIYSDNLT